MPPAPDGRDAPRDARVRCEFYARVQLTDAPTYRYDRIEVDGYDWPGYLETFTPPLAGDSIYLSGDRGGGGVHGTFRVLERSWMHSAYGSQGWPYGERHPRSGALLTLIVEPAEGMFRHEHPSADEDADA
jgi:hypothetical protein